MISVNLLQYFATAVIAYLGLFLGSFLIKFAPEEQKPGKTYFILLKKIIFMIAFAMMLYFFQVNHITTFVLLGFLLLLLLTKKLNLSKNRIIYFIFGVMFAIATQIQTLFIIIATLTFIYGMPTASVLFNPKKKNYLEVLKTNYTFFIPIIIIPWFL